MTRKHVKPTVPHRDLKLLADHLFHSAVNLAEEAGNWVEVLATLPGGPEFVKKIIDYQAAVDAYKRAYEP